MMCVMICASTITVTVSTNVLMVTPYIMLNSLYPRRHIVHDYAYYYYYYYRHYD